MYIQSFNPSLPFHRSQPFRSVCLLPIQAVRSRISNREKKTYLGMTFTPSTWLSNSGYFPLTPSTYVSRPSSILSRPQAMQSQFAQLRRGRARSRDTDTGGKGRAVGGTRYCFESTIIERYSYAHDKAVRNIVIVSYYVVTLFLSPPTFPHHIQPFPTLPFHSCR